MTLTHWGRVKSVNKTIMDSDNGLSPGRRQVIIWTNAGILLIGPLGTNFSEILIEIQTFSLTKIRLEISSANCRQFCIGLNMLTQKEGISNHTSKLCDNNSYLKVIIPYWYSVGKGFKYTDKMHGVKTITIITKATIVCLTLQLRHNEHDVVSYHQPHNCLLNSLFKA